MGATIKKNDVDDLSTTKKRRTSELLTFYFLVLRGNVLLILRCFSLFRYICNGPKRIAKLHIRRSKFKYLEFSFELLFDESARAFLICALTENPPLTF